ncbi:hypothetical protein XU18_4043 [Perkinsela sp. CCAP 1560/4]|nr:hypothetical protein XU18_4043 [Perkinsela sp. CCAP 1560/4]|eukprot:KNH04756.1 hypothetical protein XU18_4043 [Perkinsela sp. CCAP 1560/4]
MNNRISDLAETLERSKSQVKIFEKDLREGKGQIKLLEELRRILEDVQNINHMSKQKLTSSVIDEIPKMTDKVPELIIRIQDLENSRVHRRNTKMNLQMKLDTLEKHLRAKKLALQAKETHLFARKGYSCWSMRRMHKENSFEAKNNAAEMEKKLATITAENRTLENRNIQQTRLIGELSADIEANAGLPEEYALLCDCLEERRRELAEICEQIEHQKRLFSQKGRILHQKKLIRDPVAQYDVKKRILQSDLCKVTASRRTEEKNILSEQNTIRQRIEKLRAMIFIVKSKLKKQEGSKGAASIDTKRSPEEENASLLQKCAEFVQIIGENKGNSNAIVELEKAIEKVENDLAVIERSKVASAKRHAIENKVRLKEVLELEADIASREVVYQKQKKVLERDNEVLAQEIQRRVHM